MTNHSR